MCETCLLKGGGPLRWVLVIRVFSRLGTRHRSGERRERPAILAQWRRAAPTNGTLVSGGPTDWTLVAVGGALAAVGRLGGLWRGRELAAVGIVSPGHPSSALAAAAVAAARRLHLRPIAHSLFPLA